MIEDTRVQTTKKQTFEASGKSVSFIPLGGIGDVTKNMYLYEYDNEILIVDCGLGFADETMLGVDLLLPDITYLLDAVSLGRKKIVGMLLTHGHEDHIGALPFILPQLPSFPIYATPLTAAFANEKLKEFGVKNIVQTVKFDAPSQKLRSFTFSFIRITHSVPDSAHIFIETPVGNFYHASDFKFDLTPQDGQKTDFLRMIKTNEKGVLALMADCLGAERSGFTPSEKDLGKNFEQEMRWCKGKFIVTTYSSNIARLNQAIQAAAKLGRKVCFVGRSIVKAKIVAQRLGYLQINDGQEIRLDELRKYKDHQLLLLIAGSQGQENSALSRIAEGDHKEISLHENDIVVFSSDVIPGNELTVNSLIDTIAETGAKVLYSDVSDKFHVSGHGSSGDAMLMMSLVSANYLVPISGTYRQMVSYHDLALRIGYKKEQLFYPENGQELLFSEERVAKGQRFEIRNVYVDQISGEEVESFVLRDREKLAREGIVIVLAEIASANGRLVGKPEVIARGFSPKEVATIIGILSDTVREVLSKNKGRIVNWVHIRKLIEESAQKALDKNLHRRPLVLPVVIEV